MPTRLLPCIFIPIDQNAAIKNVNIPYGVRPIQIEEQRRLFEMDTIWISFIRPALMEGCKVALKNKSQNERMFLILSDSNTGNRS